MTFVTVYDIDCVVLVLILSHGRPKTICIMKNINYESHVTCANQVKPQVLYPG